MRSRPPLFLHVGLAKTGTTFLQSVLAQNRPRLREAGFLYPFVRPEGMFHAAVEVRHDEARWGLDAELIAGTWRALLDKAADFGGTAVISHEILAGATATQIAEAARALERFDLHLVVTARDLARQIPAHWQEAVKNGQTFSFAEFTREVCAEPGAPDSRFWEEQDLIAVLDRWAPLVAADHVHLVVCPPPGAPRDELWRRFTGALGLPAETVELGVAQANESLGAAEVHLLRRVNAALGGEIEQPAYAHVVKRLFAQRLLSAHASAPARTPESLRGLVEETAGRWIRELRTRGYAVHGDLDDLTPRSFATVHPDDLDPEALPDVPALVAALLRELVRVRAAQTPPADVEAGRRDSWHRRLARLRGPIRRRLRPSGTTLDA